jgi:hypothetical protein
VLQLRADTAWLQRIKPLSAQIQFYKFSSNAPFLKLECPLSGAIDIGISQPLHNQASKKAVKNQDSKAEANL